MPHKNRKQTHELKVQQTFFEGELQNLIVVCIIAWGGLTGTQSLLIRQDWTMGEFPSTPGTTPPKIRKFEFCSLRGWRI